MEKKKELDLYEYISNDKWCIFFSHPADYTPVCTTELSEAVRLVDEFNKRSCKLVAFSCNSFDSHQGWSKDILKTAGWCIDSDFPFPIIVDEKRIFANQFLIMDPQEKDTQGLPLTCRAVFFISPDKKLKAKILYPATTGRSFTEILRVLDSLQLTDKFPVATPEGWRVGEKCMVVPTLDDEKARQILNTFETVDLPSQKKYMRYTPYPKSIS